MVAFESGNVVLMGAPPAVVLGAIVLSVTFCSVLAIVVLFHTSVVLSGALVVLFHTFVALSGALVGVVLELVCNWKMRGKIMPKGGISKHWMLTRK